MRTRLHRQVRDAGTTTAEYAIATLAATAFAGVLLALLKGPVVAGFLNKIIRTALSVG
jgi:hypothetical protein